MTRRPAQPTWATSAATTCWCPTSSAPVKWRHGSSPSTWSTHRWCRPDNRSLGPQQTRIEAESCDCTTEDVGALFGPQLADGRPGALAALVAASPFVGL